MIGGGKIVTVKRMQGHVPCEEDGLESFSGHYELSLFVLIVDGRTHDFKGTTR
ncbi:hypothetical protein Sjap_016200 [Stephania japonica]|uniref:Uncharacterized protein n=1 Tax=Stephania japonica TaxID=461633 RepID=A0AAP0IKP0_9MAGN